MKKNITFDKKITFPTMIGEITAIDLEHTLNFIDKSNIEGNFIVKGKYKLTEASRIEEDFSYKIPVEIALVESLDLNTTNIDIVDFYYEIDPNDTLNCHIEIALEGLEEIVTEEIIDNDERECDGDIKKDTDKEIPHKEDKMNIEKRNELEETNTNIEEVKEEKVEEPLQEENSLSNIFSSLTDKEETFATYSVYILREEETINTITQKYNTTKEELEKYNDLSTLTKGSKIIIPILNND